MPLLFQRLISRADLRANPQVLYVFGDNLARQGLGGQASAMRGEPNAVGLPTKASPQSYLQDHMLEQVARLSYMERFQLLQQLTHYRRIVVWPLDGIGTGLAELGTRAPLIAKFWEDFLSNLKSAAEV